MDFNLVIIWGHTNKSHTHYWIHHAFNRAFKYMKYNTLWLHDSLSSIKKINFSSKVLFLTEGQSDEYIPIKNSYFYILHNCNNPKYKNVKAIKIQVYSNPILKKYTLTKYDDFLYYSITKKICYMPWGTDLLPDEIQEIIDNMKNIINSKQNVSYYIGSVWSGTFGNIDQLTPYKNNCISNNIKFHSYTNIPMKQNIKYIQKGKYSPTIVGKWQQERGYIPCRAFKNISYGGYCITNSLEVYQLFDKKICYEPDTSKLFQKVDKYIQDISFEDLLTLIRNVKDKHTYVSRIKFLFYVINLI